MKPTAGKECRENKYHSIRKRKTEMLKAGYTGNIYIALGQEFKYTARHIRRILGER